MYVFAPTVVKTSECEQDTTPTATNKAEISTALSSNKQQTTASKAA